MANEEKKKTRRPTAQKRNLQNAKRREQNRMFRSKVRTAIRKFQGTAGQGDASQAQEHLNAVYSLMDKGVKLGVFKKNKAARTKARLAARHATIG